MFTEIEMKMMAFITTQTEIINSLKSAISSLQGEVTALHDLIPASDTYVTEDDFSEFRRETELQLGDHETQLHDSVRESGLEDYITKHDLEQEIEDKVKEILQDVTVTTKIEF